MTCNSGSMHELTVPQAKEAMRHPYFDDLDKEAVDALENQAIQAYYP